MLIKVFTNMKIDKEDWHEGVSREMSFFMTNEIIKSYNNMFKKYKIAFFNVLFHIENGILTMIRKKSELEALKDFMETLSEKFIVKELEKADELHKKMKKKLKTLKLDKDNWKGILSMCEELWIYTLFSIYFGYATERENLKKIGEKHYELLKDAREIGNLQVLDDFLKKQDIDLTELNDDEIKKYLKSGKIPSNNELNERRVECLIVMENLKARRISKEKIKDTISKYLKKEDYSKFKELKGNIAYKKNVKGIVRIILKKKDLSNLKKGEIIVTLMTSPEYMPYMSKVKGIVTDNGGAACHASIIAREMKIPCIVGTRFATKFFKNGDLIEVDANKGVVRKLK